MRAIAYLGGVALVSLVVALWIEGAGGRGFAWLLAVLLPLYAAGVFAYWKRPDLPISRLLLSVGTLWALSSVADALLSATDERGGEEPWLWVIGIVSLLLLAASLAATATLFAFFPDGRAHGDYERWIVAAIWAWCLLVPLGVLLSSNSLPPADGVENPLAVPALAETSTGTILYEQLGASLFVGLALLALRYRRFGQEQRRQIRWLLVVPLVGLIAVALAALLRLEDTSSRTVDVVVAVVGYVLLALIPLSILAAILRHRVLDVDLVLRNSLVYGALWLLLAAVYVASAAALGIASAERLPVAMAVLVAIAATLGFQPVRRRLERLVDRWVFGRRLTGYEVLERFGETLEQTFDPSELLPRLAETVCRGLNLRWARVLLSVRGARSWLRDPVASVGIEPGSDVEPAATVSLTHGGESLGAIECSPRVDGSFSEDDRRVLEHLARQASLAIRNALLASELAGRLEEIRRQAVELAASRERLVQAQDAERRRIERNIHDGVQQELVVLIAKLRLARNQLSRDRARAEETLAELQVEAALALADLRELAQGIHPSVLSDAGLVEAVEARAARLPLDVSIRTDASVRARRYDDEIEGAAYFVVSESLANALKHASARRVDVRLREEGDRLVIEVADDGTGFDAEAVEPRGLANLADRLAALGGAVRTETQPGAGTTVCAELPVETREPAHA